MPNGADVLVQNCTSVYNQSSSGGGVSGASGGNLTLWNSIAYFNTPDNWNTWDGYHYWYYCNTTHSSSTHGRNYFIEGNFNDLPLFVDPENDNYRLQRTSPCRDAGQNQPWMATALDLDGRPRLDSGAGIVDVGTYEYQHPGTILRVR